MTPRQAFRPRAQEAPRHARDGQGLPGRRQPALPGRQGGGPQGRSVPVSRPAQPQARLPPAVDHPDQRGRAPERPLLLAVHSRPPDCAGSSWTARSWPTSPCTTPTPSDALPTAPARRWPPAERQPTTSTATRAPLLRSRRPFCCLTTPMTITSPHNAKLKEIRKLGQRRRGASARASSSPRARTCSRPPTPPAGPRSSATAPPAAGLPGTEVEPALLASASELGIGDAGAGGLRGALGSRADRAAVRLPARGP